MKIVTRAKEMQDLSLQWKKEGKRIALVPTMGYLHEGHLSLVDAARSRADIVVMSVFVNPTQFGPLEDFEKYPRDLQRDQALAEGRGVDCLFVPENGDMYPEGAQTFVTVNELSRNLCGAFRPGHFRGVATIVAKLFLIVLPDVAVFGEKDYQQLKVIERMARDLFLRVEVLGIPTLREGNGLAMSSRNVYLNDAERAEALNLSRSIALAQEMLRGGERNAERIARKARELLESGPGTKVQYAEIVDAETLQPVTTVQGPCRFILAVYLNGKRLIDNGPLLP